MRITQSAHILSNGGNHKFPPFNVYRDEKIEKLIPRWKDELKKLPDLSKNNRKK